MNFRLLLSFSALTATAFSQPRPLDGNPGNVFVKGQDVEVQTSATEAAKWICIDYEGRQIAEGSGEAKLGKLGVGYYEIWQLKEDGSRKERTTVAVLEPLKVPVPDNTPIALDTAAAWFWRKPYKNGFGLKEAANLSALAGVKWTRDRLNWKETEPECGKFADASIYDESAAAFAEQGLKVLQVFHDTPPWAGERAKFYPDDYRDVYRYLKTMSARWKGKVQAWEPWNEGDATHFGGHTGADMMSYQRAAFHGIRAGNPDAIVCWNVFAEHRKTGVISNYIENMDSNTLGSYGFPFDTFNFHHYVQPGSIPKSYAEMRDASGDKPMWVTESYFHFKQGVKTSDLDMSADQRKLRARFVTMNLATALNEGPEMFFTFLLPHYVESGVLFGLLNQDGTPRPDYLALAAAGRLLAGAKTTGKVNVDFPAYSFSAKPDGEHRHVIVTWSDKPREFPAKWNDYEKAYDFLGREVKPDKIGIDPVYLVFASDKLGSGLPTEVNPPVILRPPDPEPASPLVVQTVFPHDRLRLASSSWEMAQGEKLSIPLRLYHFGEGTVNASVTVDADPAITASVSEKSFEVGSEGRKDAILELSWSGKTVPAKPLLVKLTAKAEGVKPCVSVIRISTQMAGVEPLSRWPVGAAADVSKWTPGSSAGDLKLAGEKGLDVVAVLKPGDRWVYPWHQLEAGEKANGKAKGIAFTITPQEGSATYHAMLREPGGTLYVASLGHLEGDGKPRRMVMLFNEFAWAGYSPEDKNQRLDREEVEAISIGGNPKDAKFRYRVENIEWVDFAE